MNKFFSTSLLGLLSFTTVSLAQDYYANARAQWFKKAEACKPALTLTEKRPQHIVEIANDTTAFQHCRAVQVAPATSLDTTSFGDKKEIILDFDEHITGHFSFAVRTTGLAADGPLRFRFTFGEVPAEVSVPFDPYPGILSRAWLQDEVVTVMHVPDTITLPRRLAFRYVKIELLGYSPYYQFNLHDLKCMASTSVTTWPEPLPPTTDPIIRQIDQVGLNTLKEGMQTVYEDGPKRDQRLWIGDLYLEALGNTYSFKQHDLTKRCLYLLAALSDTTGYLLATVIEQPVPRAQDKQFLFEYALLYNVALKDYLEATGDRTTAEDLWPVAKKQLDIVRENMRDNGLMDYEKLEETWWVFFDWREELHKEAATQGLAVFALRESYRLAELLGHEKEVADLPALIKKMTKAARKHMYNPATGLFTGTTSEQVSYASQIWMILGGIATPKEGQRALTALRTIPDVCRPGTPYLYHYYIQALLDCGMRQEAKQALATYWGGMVEKGADTFWETYDPQDDFLSQYNFYPLNSYCHAWSCTPVYFIRKYPEVFQR